MAGFPKKPKRLEEHMAQGRSFNMGKFAGAGFHSIRPEEWFIRTAKAFHRQPGTKIIPSLSITLEYTYPEPRRWHPLPV
jgi:hypothetical protein